MISLYTATWLVLQVSGLACHTYGMYFWLVSTLHLAPSSCTLCQPVLIISTSDKKYRCGVPFKVLVLLSTLGCTCTHAITYIIITLYCPKDKASTICICTYCPYLYTEPPILTYIRPRTETIPFLLCWTLSKSFQKEIAYNMKMTSPNGQLCDNNAVSGSSCKALTNTCHFSSLNGEIESDPIRVFLEAEIPTDNGTKVHKSGGLQLYLPRGEYTYVHMYASAYTPEL